MTSPARRARSSRLASGTGCSGTAPERGDPMNPEAGLLADILEHPDDDTPRLIFADWLEDKGEQDRAEFIRIQLQIAKLAENDPIAAALGLRLNYLWDAHGEEWSAPFGFRVPGHANFERGFLNSLSLP